MHVYVGKIKHVKKKFPKVRKINVGITLKVDNPKESLWTNGIKQNSITLKKMYSLLPNIGDVRLINFGKGEKETFKGSEWEEHVKDIITPAESLDKHKVDVIVTAMITPSIEYIEKANKLGIKVIKQIMGNEYEIFSEQVLFEYDGIPQTNFYGRRKGYSANWISPHFYQQNKDLMEVISDVPSSIGPYIWDPIYIEHAANATAKSLKKESGLYIPSGKKEKRINTFEPNINLVKTSITPMLAIEKMYRKTPDLINRCKIFCTSRIKKKNIFIQFARDLDIYVNKKMTFESRYPMAFSLLNYTDIVIAHQRNLDLNYAYFDAAWLGYPLVHNSKTLEGLGYYYDGWDADEASDLLIEIAKNFDNEYEEYIKKSREYISRYFPENEDNIKKYTLLFEDLFK